MTPSELKYEVEQLGSKFFSRENMKFLGDTMGNYGCRSSVIDVLAGGSIEVWELYRKRPVNDGLHGSAYFRKDTYRQTWGVSHETKITK